MEQTLGISREFDFGRRIELGQQKKRLATNITLLQRDEFGFGRREKVDELLAKATAQPDLEQP